MLKFGFSIANVFETVLLMVNRSPINGCSVLIAPISNLVGMIIAVASHVELVLKLYLMEKRRTSDTSVLFRARAM